MEISNCLRKDPGRRQILAEILAEIIKEFSEGNL